MNNQIKIIFHVIALSFFLFGSVILHVVFNSNSNDTFMLFFGIPIEKSIIFDTGLLFFGMGFFIEFFLTFKPILIAEYKKKKR